MDKNIYDNTYMIKYVMKYFIINKYVISPESISGEKLHRVLIHLPKCDGRVERMMCHF